jgi:hypothetical protein
MPGATSVFSPIRTTRSGAGRPRCGCCLVFADYATLTGATILVPPSTLFARSERHLLELRQRFDNGDDPNDNSGRHPFQQGGKSVCVLPAGRRIPGRWVPGRWGDAGLGLCAPKLYAYAYGELRDYWDHMNCVGCVFVEYFDWGVKTDGLMVHARSSSSLPGLPSQRSAHV